jgi:subtilisin family serine protease
MARTVRALLLSFAACVLLYPVASASAGAPARTQVVVTLHAPGLATAMHASRALTNAVKDRRLDLDSPTSRGYLRELERERSAVERRIRARVPSASIRWRYAVVLNGLAVALPRRDVPLLSKVPGVLDVQAGGRFGVSLDRGPELIGADDLWGGPSLPFAGNGVKIGVIDDGVNQDHPFFNPAGFSYPPGFPKGQTGFTTPKVIVARAFAPATTTWRHARTPFDPVMSEHGTHVAGIAAGNVSPGAVPGRGTLSGNAPRAYIGNYKVLSSPSSFGLIDNAGEVVAGIEAAVRDGMDVINMSFGEYETDPARNVVDRAVDGAAAAGVVPVAAAGNSGDLGRGSIGSPATASRAIAVAAVTKTDVLADFSSSGPTALSLRMKPEVSAPGASILSSVPEREGTWASFSGTSMASPHVAGAVALLLQRHPEWTVDQVTSALVQTGRPVTDAVREQETVATREGGGLVNLPEAVSPLVFVKPAVVSLGLLRIGTSKRATMDVTDAGGGTGSWNVSLRVQEAPVGVKLTIPPTVSVPGSLELVAETQQTVGEGDLTGFIVLQRAGVTRRIPFWLRTVDRRLGPPAGVLTKQGRYEGNTRNGKANVTAYRYPDDPSGLGVSNSLPGPEQVFRIRVQGTVANVGARITRMPRGVNVTPRLVYAGDENRLAGIPSLPVDVNPYRGNSHGSPRPAVAAIRPSAGSYDLVFDTRARADAGPFSFRVWIDDKTPPKVKLLTPTARSQLLLSIADSGSGVDPLSLVVLIDGRRSVFTLASGRIRVPLDGVSRGPHRVRVIAADFQETKNSESVVGVLPNTMTFTRAFTAR